MVHRLAYILIAILFGSLSPAALSQVNYQLVMDTSSTDGPMVDEALQTASGSQFVAMWTGPSIRIYRFDPVGQPTWAISLLYGEPVRYLAMCGDGGEGFFIAMTGNFVFLDQVWADPDTMIEHLELAHIDEAGAVTWSHRYERRQISDLAVFPSNGLRLTAAESGEVFMQLNARSNIDASQWSPIIARIDGAGTMLWAHYVGHFSGMPGEIPSFFGGSCLITPQSDGAGGSFLGPTFDNMGPVNHVQLAHLDAMGALLWANMYTYDVPLIYSDARSVTVDIAGRLCVTNEIAQMGADRLYVLRTLPGGTIDRADLYERPYLNSGDRSHTALNGQLCIVSEGWAQPLITRLDVGAEPLTCWMQPIVPASGSTFDIDWTFTDLQQDRLSISGDLRNTDDTLGVQTFWPRLQMVDLNTPASCELVDLTPSHTPIPTSLIAVTPILDFATMDASGELSIQPATLAVSPTPIVPVLDMCEMVMGMEDEGMGDANSPILENTLMDRTAQLHITNVAPGILTLFDVRGRQLLTLTVPVRQQALELPAPLNSGMYLLSWRGYAGSASVAHRFVVE